jgi:hypothetical protein
VGFYTAGGAAADQIAQSKNSGVGNEIDDAVALAAAANEAAIVESMQMLGDIGLIALKGSGDLVDGEFAVFEELKDAEAVGFAEEAEAAGDGFEDAGVGEGAKGRLARSGHGGIFSLDYTTI